MSLQKPGRGLVGEREPEQQALHDAGGLSVAAGLASTSNASSGP